MQKVKIVVIGSPYTPCRHPIDLAGTLHALGIIHLGYDRMSTDHNVVHGGA